MSAVLEPEYISIERTIPMRRVWAMPSPNTFDIPPIRALVKSYLYKSRVSVDPFARNKKWATYTNDLNPDTSAQYHLEAKEFLETLTARGVRADCGVFDPPYSPRQISEVYAEVGATYDWKTGCGWREVRDAFDQVLIPGAMVICCGWNSQGFGIERGYELVELLLVSHGREHNDTIVTVERKIEDKQNGLFLQ